MPPVNFWEFNGTVIEVNERPGKDRTYRSIVVSDGGQKWPRLCVCDLAKQLHFPKLGDRVHVSGVVSGREWSGKYYAGLRATQIVFEVEDKPLADETPEQQQQQEQQSNPAPKYDDIPF